MCMKYRVIVNKIILNTYLSYRWNILIRSGFIFFFTFSSDLQKTIFLFPWRKGFLYGNECVEFNSVYQLQNLFLVKKKRGKTCFFTFWYVVPIHQINCGIIRQNYYNWCALLSKKIKKSNWRDFSCQTKRILNIWLMFLPPSSKPSVIILVSSEQLILLHFKILFSPKQITEKQYLSIDRLLGIILC